MWQGRSGVGGGEPVQQHDCSRLLLQLLFQSWSGVERLGARTAHAFHGYLQPFFTFVYIDVFSESEWVNGFQDIEYIHTFTAPWRVLVRPKLSSRLGLFV